MHFFFQKYKSRVYFFLYLEREKGLKCTWWSPELKNGLKKGGIEAPQSLYYIPSNASTMPWDLTCSNVTLILKTSRRAENSVSK